MKSYLSLIPISAKVNRKKSRMTRICIILAVFLITAIFSMADMEIQSQKMQVAQQNGCWHAAFVGLTDEEAQLLSSRPQVNRISLDAHGEKTWQIGNFQADLYGFDENTEKLMPAIAITEGHFPNNANEAVATERIKTLLGIDIGDTFTITDQDGLSHSLILTGFCGNTSITDEKDIIGLFVNEQTWKEQLEPAYTLDDITYLVEFKNGTNIQQQIDTIKTQFNIDDAHSAENVKFLALLFQSDNSYMQGFYITAVILSLLVAIAGILMITGSLNSNVAQRIEFFGMLRCLGANRRQIIRFVRLEALNWCKTAIPIGLGGGIIITWILCALLRYLSPSLFEEMPVFGFSPLGIIAGIVIGIITVFVSAASPARKAANVSPISAVSGNTVPSFQTKKAARAKSFKIETALGLHRAVGQKKNLLLMTGSFAFSIILFLSFSASIDFMHRAIRPLRPYTPDLSIVSSDNTCSINQTITDEIAKNPSVKRIYGRSFAYNLPATINGENKTVTLISYETNQFNWAEDELLSGSLESVINGNGVMTVYNDNSPVPENGTITLSAPTGKSVLPITCQVTNLPFDREDSNELIVCSEALFEQLTGQKGYTIIDIQLNSGATDDDVAAIRSLADSNSTFSDQRSSNAEARGAYFSFALFLYGFLVIIALIAIFNIVNSISLSVSAHLKEYGAMRAVGMSDKQLIKMVGVEAFTYALIGIIIGYCVGLPINYILFKILVTAQWGDTWTMPIIPIIVILAVILFAVMLAIRTPAKRIQSLSIVDTISAQ